MYDKTHYNKKIKIKIKKKSKEQWSELKGILCWCVLQSETYKLLQIFKASI